MPKSDIKPNDLDDRQQQKRITDLENLYEMLPDVEPDVIEMHYDQFEGDTLMTYNYLSRGMHNFARAATAIFEGGFTPYNDDYALHNLVTGGSLIPPPRDMDEVQVAQANLPPEEKKMLNKAIKEEKKKEVKERKKAGKAKSKGWCG